MVYSSWCWSNENEIDRGLDFGIGQCAKQECASKCGAGNVRTRSGRQKRHTVVACVIHLPEYKKTASWCNAPRDTVVLA
jgi:hypothetical protein